MRLIIRSVVLAATALAAALAIAASAQAADGRVYAWEHAYTQGRVCSWVGNDTNWTTCSPGGNLRNQASTLWNNGYAGGNDDVNFYWGLSYTGAWDCLRVGTWWSNLQYQRFIYGAGRSGYNQVTNDNISSHKWVSYCGQA